MEPESPALQGTPLRKPRPQVPEALVETRDALYTVTEELVHAVTHGVGAVLAVVGLTVLVARATLYGNAWHITAVSIFGATLVLMYTASTLYHSIPLPRAKNILRVLDHSLIFFLIAGSYTPFTLITLHGPWGWSLFAFTWGITLIGVILKVRAPGRFEKLHLALYLGMGWCVVVAIKPLLEAMEPAGVALLIAGGLTYTGGVAFYLSERLRYHHAIWHLFVLAGSVLHYFAVLFYVIPGPVLSGIPG